MTLALWLIPAVITMAGLLPIAIFMRRATEEARLLQDSMRRFGDLRPALVELRSHVRGTRDAWEQLGRR
ncbi:MAG: hypothetical protein JOZ37_11395 [Actinobacteria bacterium]|nr:hypothetical protein [Actinomycetota bacterium]MBV8957422.1 hypothetical protein [Actinomycetota bacterium]MBV9253070.1 hypothetical protein [Actinomycetota bacterium]MBV9664563.1 hypothetical protein [Actinomycetota bacterium]MBV9933792.1 hypothetical protein [Actinomycetota bacterium]